MYLPTYGIFLNTIVVPHAKSVTAMSIGTNVHNPCSIGLNLTTLYMTLTHNMWKT